MNLALTRWRENDDVEACSFFPNRIAELTINCIGLDTYGAYIYISAAYKCLPN